MQNYTAAPDGASVSLIPEESAPTCEQCGKPFARREASGGTPQRFCSPECRTAFHSENRSVRQRSPACNAATEQAAAPLAETPKATHGAAEAVLAAYLEGRREEQEDVFDWHRDDSIALERQLSIAIYLNPRDHLVIRQEREADQDEDTFIYIAPQNIAAFIDHLCRVAGVPRGKRS
jgi:hypothetical protein